MHLEIPVDRFNKILQRLSDPEMIDLTEFDLLLEGTGGQSRLFYKNLSSDSDVEVLWSGWHGPAWTSFFSFIIPGEAGLIKIVYPEKLKALFEELSATSLTTILYVRKEMTQKVMERISSRRHRDVRRILEHEKEFVYLTAEQDDIVQEGTDCYFLHDYMLGTETAAVIRTVFSGLK